MANWRSTLDVKNEWEQRRSKEITINQLGKSFADKLRKNIFYRRDQEELEAIAKRFEKAKSAATFDRALRDLYDYGDYDHRIWIETF